MSVFLCLLALGRARAQDIPQSLAKAVPGFDAALISAAAQRAPGVDGQDGLLTASYEAAKAGQPLPLGATPDALARAYVQRALAAPGKLDEACSYLDGLGPEGRAAEQRLRAVPWTATVAPASPAKLPLAVPTDSLRAKQWDESGARREFDGAVPGSGAPAVVAGPGTPHPSGLSPNLPPVLTKPPPPGTIKIVSVGIEKLQKLAISEVYTERKEGFDKSFGLTPGSNVGGAGVFTAKILNAAEVAADPVKQGARDAAARDGKKIVFVRTDTKAQLNGGVTLPVDAPAGANAGIGLRLSGIVEIVETREVPEDGAEAALKAESRVFLWPLTAQHLRDVMKVGEDLTITGRLDEGAALSIGAGLGLGPSRFARVGTSAGASAGKAADQWVTLRVKKVDPDHVRILVQRADGEVMSANVSASAGLDIYDDSFIPRAGPPSLEEGLIGKAVVGGEKSVLHQVEQLASASLSGSWGEGKDDVATEGWAAVPLSDPKTAAALNSLFKFRPEAMRALPPDATFSDALKSGRLNADVRDVTHSASFQAHLSKLRVTASAGTVFYEVRWAQDDGTIKHYVVGIADKHYHGDVTKTNRAEESAMWYDLDSGQAAVTVSLGPQDRLFTTTREKINDVIATQKAMGVPVQGEVHEPKPYLQLFGLGNYGRSEETGSFSLAPQGVVALKTASRPELLAAYLRADWLYEKESYPPGKHFWDEDQAPPWATESTDALAPVLAFLNAHAAEARRMQGDKDSRSQLSQLQNAYEQVAAGRGLVSDAWRFTSAVDYANAVRDMQNSDKPERLIELFLEFRRSDDVDLKRAVVATASLAGTRPGVDGPIPNWQGFIQMTGSRVQLRPAVPPPPLPAHPVSRIASLIGSWQQ